MRQFIRHPSDVPIEIQSAPDDGYIRRSVKNVSFGVSPSRRMQPSSRRPSSRCASRI